MSCGFLIQLVFTSGNQSVTPSLSGAPLIKKNSGSAPDNLSIKCKQVLTRNKTAKRNVTFNVHLLLRVWPFKVDSISASIKQSHVKVLMLPGWWHSVAVHVWVWCLCILGRYFKQKNSGTREFQFYVTCVLPWNWSLKNSQHQTIHNVISLLQ